MLHRIVFFLLMLTTIVYSDIEPDYFYYVVS